MRVLYEIYFSFTEILPSHQRIILSVHVHWENQIRRRTNVAFKYINKERGI